MRAYLSAILLLCSVLCVSAQDIYKISGKVVDKDGNAVEYAAVVLSRGGMKPKGTTSAADGSFALTAAAGKYNLEVSLVGYDKFSVAVSLDRDIVLQDIVLQEDVRMLAGAKIAANRIEYTNTGYEYKISNIAALQNLDLSDVLKTAPGITAISDRLLLYGEEIANVYVDRRRIKMKDKDLINYLNGFKGDNIEKIEVISDPDVSALHAGTAIRITTRKQTGGIASASVSINGSDCKLVLRPNMNLTYRRGKMVLYTSDSYMYMTHKDEQSVLSEWLSGRRERETTATKLRIPLSAGGTIGAGYDLSKNDYLSAELSYREIRRHQDRDIYTESAIGGNPGVTEHRAIEYSSVYSTPEASVMYEHKFRDASTLTVTSDYVGSYKITDIAGAIEQNRRTNNTSTFAGYAGYAKRFDKQHSLNAGVRYSYIGNESAYDDQSFSYKESDIKPFASYAFSGNKIGANIGLQGHITDIGGKSFADIAPNVSLNWFIDRKLGHRLGTTYSRSVVRPSIYELNANAVFSDSDIIINTGNPDLTSYYSQNYGLNLTLFNKYNLRTSYSTADNAITSYMYDDEIGNIYRTYVNNAEKRNAGVNLSTNFTLFKRLSLSLTGRYNYEEIAVDGNRNSNNSLGYSVSVSLSLPKSYSLDMTVSGSTGYLSGYNTTQKDVPLSNLIFNKSLNNWRFGLILFNVFDNGGGSTTTIDMGEYTKTVSRTTSLRSLQFSVSYNFRWGEAGGIRRVQSDKSTLSTRIGR